MDYIYICRHCGENMKGKDKEPKTYCGGCNTAEKRKKVDQENQAIRDAKKSS